MRRGVGRLVLTLVVLLTLVALFLLGTDRLKDGTPAEIEAAVSAWVEDLLPPGGPDEEMVPLPEVSRPDCAADPARLAPPVAPDGRRPSYLHICENRLYDADGRPVRITGVNWSGLEAGDLARMGLAHRSWQSILDQVATLGYNAIRLPFSNEVLRPDYRPGGADPVLNPDLVGLTGLDVLDRMIAGARKRGLRVVLDRHWPTTAGPAQLWSDRNVSEAAWIDDWRLLARRYLGNDTVVGVDLHNEPGSEATWGWGGPTTDWRLAAERAGNAVLAENPYLLILVEGITRRGEDWYWQGGYLDAAASQPVRLNVPNRLVYSPHDYGPSVYPQGWFQVPDFPANLPAVWYRHWAYLQDRAIAPLVVGELGGPSVGDDADGRWQRTLLDYLSMQGIGFFVWALNPDSAGTGGILADDWQTVQTAKQSAYARLLAGPIDRGTTARLGAPRGRLRAHYRPASVAPRARQVDFSVELVNEGDEAVPLRGLELRYWLTTGALRPADQRLVLETERSFPWPVDSRLEQVTVAGADSAIVLRFAEDAAPLQPGRKVGPLSIRLWRRDRSSYIQSNDYSFSPVDQPEWSRLTIHHGNDLIWGVEPPG